jgi:outer membrane protein assembly factor BamB
MAAKAETGVGDAPTARTDVEVPTDREGSRPATRPNSHTPLADAPGAADEADGDSPGADLFKRWLWLPGPVALGYLGTALFTRQTSSTEPWLVLAAAVCLPAQALAWSWASHRWRRWTDWRLFGSASLTVALLVSLAIAAAGRLHQPRDTVYRVGIAPNDVVGAGDALWVSDPTDQVVYRLSDDKDQSIRPIPVPGAFELATDGETVWVSQVAGKGDDTRRPSLTRLRADGSIAETRTLPAHPADIAATERSVWIAFIDTGEVGRVETASGRLEVWKVGISPASLTIDGDSVWITDTMANRVIRVDTISGRVKESIETGDQPIGIDAFDGRVWIANASSGTVTRYDARSGLRMQFRVPALPTDIAIDNGTLWIVSQEGKKLIAVDADSGESRLEVSLSGQPNKLEVVGSNVLVANPGNGLVHSFPAQTTEIRE